MSHGNLWHPQRCPWSNIPMNHRTARCLDWVNLQVVARAVADHEVVPEGQVLNLV